MTESEMKELINHLALRWQQYNILLEVEEQHAQHNMTGTHAKDVQDALQLAQWQMIDEIPNVIEMGLQLLGTPDDRERWAAYMRGELTPPAAG